MEGQKSMLMLSANIMVMQLYCNANVVEES